MRREQAPSLRAHSHSCGGLERQLPIDSMLAQGSPGEGQERAPRYRARHFGGEPLKRLRRSDWKREALPRPPPRTPGRRGSCGSTRQGGAAPRGRRGLTRNYNYLQFIYSYKNRVRANFPPRGRASACRRAPSSLRCMACTLATRWPAGYTRLVDTQRMLHPPPPPAGHSIISMVKMRIEFGGILGEGEDDP